MAGEVNLRGHRVLVVEDSYLVALDTVQALEEAGAEVMGPCTTEEDARNRIQFTRPTAAVVDINLGPALSFTLAKSLGEWGIPFLFVTAHNPGTIPKEFDHVRCLPKPALPRDVVRAISEL